MKPHLLLIFAAFDGLFMQAQPTDTWQWAVNVVQSSGHLTPLYGRSQHLSCDNSGNSFILASSYGAAASPSLVADTGAFLARYDLSGALSWAKNPGGYPHTICASPSGDVYLAGRHQEYYGMAYIEKLDSHGDRVWKRVYKGYSAIEGMTVAPSGDLYVTGFAMDTLRMDGFTMFSRHAFFIAKVTGSGSTVWLRSADIIPEIAAAADVASGYYVTVDKNENVFVAFNINYCPNWSCNTNSLMKLDKNGNYIFHKNYGGYRATCHGLVVEDNGDIIMGHYTDVSTSAGQVVLKRYNSTLSAFSWSLFTGSWQCRQLLLDAGPVAGADGFLYIGGNVGAQCWVPKQDTLWFGAQMVVTDSLQDLIVCRIDKTTGTYSKVWHVKGRMNDGVASLKCDPLGNCYVSGTFNVYQYEPIAGDTLCFDSHCIAGGQKRYQVYLARLRLSDQVLSDNLGSSFKQSLKIHPNPSRGKFLIDRVDPGEWQVFDLNGRLIMQGDKQVIDLSGQFSGIYICRLKSSDGLSYHRLVKE